MKIQYSATLVLLLLVFVSTLLGCQATPEQPVWLDWIQQVSTSGAYDDISHAIDGNSDFYITGQTSGAFSGQNNRGGNDVFLSKHDNKNNLVWTRQFGTTGDDISKAIAVNPEYIYVIGSTTGIFDSQSGKGGIDAFLTKFDSEGTQLWIRQFGSASNDYAYDVSTDDSGIYITGYTYGELSGEKKLGDADAFLAKYNPEGDLLWLKQFGSDNSDYGSGVSVSESSIYITGTTYGTLPGMDSIGVSDAFIAKYNEEGDQIWVKQFGTSDSEYANGISVDHNGVYITGVTFGAFSGYSNIGGIDAFLSNYDHNGNQIWNRQFGTSDTDLCWDVCTYLNNAYVTGYTFGVFPSQNKRGQYDIFAAVYDMEGNTTRTYQFGTSSDDYAKGIFVNEEGLFVTGSTLGTFPNQTRSKGYDLFIAELK